MAAELLAAQAARDAIITILMMVAFVHHEGRGWVQASGLARDDVRRLGLSRAPPVRRHLAGQEELTTQPGLAGNFWEPTPGSRGLCFTNQSSGMNTPPSTICCLHFLLYA
mmetsp:Transcript_2592/g.5164  ORF Transcript_2592/g.5164 Transcript_2592/m.5164 type:complete len:110 (+) Transcript_2592:2423-2752(+)